MKTLDDVIKDMFRISGKTDWLDMTADDYDDFVAEQMRRACNMMLEEIIPQELKESAQNRLSVCWGWNDCRDEIIKRGKEFLNEEK